MCGIELISIAQVKNYSPQRQPENLNVIRWTHQLLQSSKLFIPDKLCRSKTSVTRWRNDSLIGPWRVRLWSMWQTSSGLTIIVGSTWLILSLNLSGTTLKTSCTTMSVVSSALSLSQSCKKSRLNLISQKSLSIKNKRSSQKKRSNNKMTFLNTHSSSST